MATETVTVSGVRTDSASWALAFGASKTAALQTPADAATSYLTAAAGVAPTAITFDMAAPTAVQNGDSISSVQFTYQRRRGTSGGNSIGIAQRILVNGTTQAGSSTTGTSTSTIFNNVSLTLNTNPVSGAAWTYTDLTQLAVQFNASATPTTASLDISTLSATITYTASGNVTGTATETAVAATEAATGLETFSGPASESDGATGLAATGSLTFSGTAAETTAAPLVAATGALTFAGSASESGAASSEDASGDQTFSGTASESAPAATVDATGGEEFSGTASAIAAVSTSEADGTVQNPTEGEDVTGECAEIAATPTVHATGTVTSPQPVAPIGGGGLGYGFGYTAPTVAPPKTRQRAITGAAAAVAAVSRCDAVGVVRLRISGSGREKAAVSRVAAAGTVMPPAWDEETELDELLLLSAI